MSGHLNNKCPRTLHLLAVAEEENQNLTEQRIIKYKSLKLTFSCLETGLSILCQIKMKPYLRGAGNTSLIER